MLALRGGSGSRIVVFIAATTVALGAGCRRPGAATPVLLIQCQVTPSPARVGPATALIRLTDRTTGRPVPDAGVSVEGDMSHAGMTPVFATAKAIGDGRYQAPLTFTMAGDWVLLIKTIVPGRPAEESQIPLPGVRP